MYIGWRLKLSELKKKKRLGKKKQDKVDRHYIIKYSTSKQYCKPVKSVVPPFSKAYCKELEKINAEVPVELLVPAVTDKNIRCQYFKADQTVKNYWGSVHKIFEHRIGRVQFHYKETLGFWRNTRNRTRRSTYIESKIQYWYKPRTYLPYVPISVLLEPKDYMYYQRKNEKSDSNYKTGLVFQYCTRTQYTDWDEKKIFKLQTTNPLLGLRYLKGERGLFDESDDEDEDGYTFDGISLRHGKLLLDHCHLDKSTGEFKLDPKHKYWYMNRK